MHGCAMVHQRLLSAGLAGRLCHQGARGQPACVTVPAASQGESLTPIPASFISAAMSFTSTDELPNTFSTARGGGLSQLQLSRSHPFPAIAIPAEHQETQKEAGEAVPGPSTSKRGSESSAVHQMRTSSPNISPASKRLTLHQSLWRVSWGLTKPGLSHQLGRAPASSVPSPPDQIIQIK